MTLKNGAGGGPPIRFSGAGGLLDVKFKACPGFPFVVRLRTAWPSSGSAHHLVPPCEIPITKDGGLRSLANRSQGPEKLMEGLTLRLEFLRLATLTSAPFPHNILGTEGRPEC